MRRGRAQWPRNQVRDTVSAMATANPLPAISPGLRAETELDFEPLDRSQLPPEVLAGLEALDERIAQGTARIVWEEDAPAALAEIRRLKAG